MLTARNRNGQGVVSEQWSDYKPKQNPTPLQEDCFVNGTDNATTDKHFLWFLFPLLLRVFQSSTPCTFIALFSGVNSLLTLFEQLKSKGRSSVLTSQPSWCCWYWWRLIYKLDCALSSEFSLICTILPLFTHSKCSYSFKSLKPVILTSTQAFTELFEGKAGLAIFWQRIFICTSLQKQNNFHFLQNNPYVHSCVCAI